MALKERRGELWSIVLAGGDGQRTKEFIRHWLGSETPKQFCTFVGTRSMLQHTLDRAIQLTPWERVVVSAARHHQGELWQQLEGRPAGMVLLQPKNVGTAAGILLPLTFILARDPEATVVIYPSDHFVHPEDAFIVAVDQAVRASALLGGRAVLLGAKPENLELEYGWIKPGRFVGWTGKAAVRAVDTFLEKPDEAAAREAMLTGSLWNTMVVAAKGKELWNLGRKCVPEMMPLFERLKTTIDTTEELNVLDEIYETMPRRSFSSDILQDAPERLAVMELKDVLWSDWGNAERIVSGLETIGKWPAFSQDPLPFLYVG
jgi:mannose-1-phosphate guanylyltransferase